MKRAILFDLDLSIDRSPQPMTGPALLSPLTDLRAAFDIRTGALTTLERWSRTHHIDALLVPDTLAPLTREPHLARNHPLPVNDLTSLPHGAPDDLTLISARCPLILPEIDALQPGHALIEQSSGHLIAWRTTIQDARTLATNSAATPTHTPTPASITILERHVLLTRPWHVRSLRDAALASDLNTLASSPTSIPPGVTRIGAHPIHIDPSARVSPTVVLDAEHGPIWIGPHATIRPGAILIGPCAIGPHSTILERTLIKQQTAIGPHCKIAGEVGGTIFQGYSNKAHDGHLGDSWLGEWVNLGAGTTNSNLLNTYAEVIARPTPGGSNERTGETFLGAIIGDHVKAAICTRIMTGAIIGTGTMWAATKPISGTIPPFTWATDAGERPYRLDKFMDVARAAMARRKLEPSDAQQQRLKALNAEYRERESTTEGHGGPRSKDGGAV